MYANIRDTSKRKLTTQNTANRYSLPDAPLSPSPSPNWKYRSLWLWRLRWRIWFPPLCSAPIATDIMQIYANIVRTTDNLYCAIIFIFCNTDNNRITTERYILVNNISIFEIIIYYVLLYYRRKSLMKIRISRFVLNWLVF